jgi:hypothetical protein
MTCVSVEVPIDVSPGMDLEGAGGLLCLAWLLGGMS